jgi:DNA-binding MarR family transcriptional regulator
VERSPEENAGEVEPSNNPAEVALAKVEWVAERLRREMHLVLRARGMTLTQFNVLRTLYREGSNGLTCSELGSRLAGTDPDITRLLDRLALHHLVRRWRDERDRRAVLTEITEEGRRLVDSVIPLLDRRIRGLFEHMTPERLQMLIVLLDEAVEPIRPDDSATQAMRTAQAPTSRTG